MIKNIFTETENFKKKVKEFDLIGFNEYKLYGCITDKDVILPIQRKLSKYQDVKNLTFVVDDLKRLLEDIKWNSNFNKIIRNSKFHISNVSITEGFLSIEEQYKKYVLILSQNFIKLQNKKFLTFKSFFKDFSQYVIKNQKLITFCSFIGSSYMSIFSSGLAFKLFSENDLSVAKAEEYIMDESFSLYHNICLKNNFLIDKYMPWVIVRRVNEKFLKDNEAYYYSAYLNSLNIMFSTIVESYIDYVSTVLNDQERAVADVNNFNINTDQFLNFYIEAKLIERGVSYFEKDIQSLRTFFKSNSKHNSQKESVRKFNTISNKKVDSIYKDWRDTFL